MQVTDAIKLFEEERERIWLNSPDDVKDLGEGKIERGTGSRGQYLSTIIFAEGETRTLADEMLWGIIRVCEDTDAELKTLQAIINQIIGYKADFFDFVNLPEAARLTKIYVETALECKNTEELCLLTKAMISYANRLHMWVDFVFPWGLGDGFRRK
ncbi:hypothetical protein [Celerinatantimonas sp. MCCC 1A17872]|uniref:cucumopine synthase-related protein n=1 Tax=Celerinatantimonas sp. MCCC 1A17872 TaxID=3177514 RepID=UPI0038BEAE2D